MAAGIERLSVFQELNTIDALAEGNIFKWDKVLQIPYELVYLKLLKNKMESDFQKRYRKVLESKNNNNPNQPRR